MRIIASFYKHEQVMFVSHLDMQRLFQRAFRRADLPLAYSNGFNPHPLLSFATALSVGYTSDCEYFDVMLSAYVSPAEFKRRVNAVLPQGVHIVDAVDAGEFKASLTPLMRSAEYDIELEFTESVPREAFYAAVDEILNGGEIIVSKKTKGGIKDVDIRPMLLGLSVSEFGGRNYLGQFISKHTPFIGKGISQMFSECRNRTGFYFCLYLIYQYIKIHYAKRYRIFVLTKLSNFH